MPKRELEKEETTSSSHKKRSDAINQLKNKFEAINTFYVFYSANSTAAVTLSSLQKVVPDVTLQDLAAINVVLPNFIKFQYITSETIEIEFGYVPSSVKKTLKPAKIKQLISQQINLFNKALADFLKMCKQKQLDASDYLLRELEKYMPYPILDDDIDDYDDNDDGEEASQKCLTDVIERLKQVSFYDGQFETVKSFDAKEPIYGELDLLSSEIKIALGVEKLYVHQTEALQALFDGQHVIVSTSTASGKSFIYQIPVLQSLLKDKNSKAMYIFPTKALAQDQKRALEAIMHRIPNLEQIMISTFDGDTPYDKRAFIRANASVIFTNPDMLHHAILPHSKLWAPFLTTLKYLVVDELHVYHGLFGTHMALIMRRLRRLCSYNNNHDLQFISCSATINEPDKHMKTMFGIENVKLINRDGSPHGKKEFIVWNPALLNPTIEEKIRKSAIVEGALLMEYLIENNVRTIAFCKVRKTCELLMKQLRQNLLLKQKQNMVGRVMSYRGGYTPHDRRKIESQMFNGELMGIIATNALELGIDIGSLDAVLMIGVPWSKSALWQQSGRAGRRNADSLSLVVCDNSPLDQFYAKQPSLLFEKTADVLSLEVDTSIVLEGHIQCAAEELAIDISKDQIYFGPQLETICTQHLVKIDYGLYRPASQFRPYPSKFVNIRNINEDTFAVVDITDQKNVIMEEIEAHRAPFEIYQGAIFIHQGRPYLVQECNIDKRYAKVQLTNVDWTTVQRNYTNVDILSTDQTKHISNTKNFVCFGKVKVTTVVFGYYRINSQKRILDAHDVYMDPIITQTTGLWADTPGTALVELAALSIDPMAAIHAASHCLISLLPQFSSSTSNDLRTECKNPNATRQRPTRVALYERQPCGIVKQAYKYFDQLIETCIQQITNCQCENGCPSCVHWTQCSEHNQVCSKQGAMIVLCAMQNSNDAS
ncbi:P-loop containing nucleoside triphosphate hydrolase protein [Helicostylum pulchrum]|nr:P-loop containing nucleoside triphosphate hydrolase protein [Helicostylum pulchrum]